MSTEHTRWIVTPADLIPAETSGRLMQTYAFYQLTQIPCAGEGGMGVRVRRRFATRRRCVDVDDDRGGGSTCVVRPEGRTGDRA